MDRVLMLRLQTQGCRAEVLLNDIPVGRVNHPGGALVLPVHEYLQPGANQVGLVIDPLPANDLRTTTIPKVAQGVIGASVRLMLPRMGQPGSELSARSLSELSWAVAEGDVFRVPHMLSREAELPIKFPRWRWLDAPEIDDVEALKPVVATYLQDIALGLVRGDVDVFLAASRLRLEELALAYQRPLPELSAKLRARLQLLHATKAMKIEIPDEDSLVLRPCANGRLLECLGKGDEPVLKTLPGPDGLASAWPVRIAVVNRQCHILR